jgi:abequosyltransferase
MKLTFGIPTHNRSQYFYIVTQNLIDQIRDLHVEKYVNIKISDNGSTDDTWSKMGDFLKKNRDIDIQVHHFETNQGADVNFLKIFEMADGEYTILKGDDDYVNPGGLKFILDLIKKNQDIDFFISDYNVINPQRKILFPVVQLREVQEQLTVNCSNEVEMRNYFSLSNSIMALGSFISAFIIRTEALKGKLDKAYYGTFYAHLYFIWHYLLNGSKKILYIRHKYIEQCFNGQTNVDFGFGIKRKAVDINICAILGDTVFKDSPYQTDIFRIAQRMYPCPIYVNYDQKRDYKNFLIPSMESSKYPNMKFAKRNSALWHLVYFILSLLPLRIDVFLRKHFL